MNLVVPSPYETEPYNKCMYYLNYLIFIILISIQMNCFYPAGSAVENDDFGDFAAFRTGSPTQNHLPDDTFFTAFQSNTALQVTYIESNLFPV